MNEDVESINDAQTMRGFADPGLSGGLGRIDQYVLERELGGGGFGTVYLAHDTTSDTHVAVKGLPPEVRGSAEDLENIRENFKLVSRLHHPNIAAALVLHPVHETVYADPAVRQKLRVDPNDTLMVMEYAPGVTLSHWRKSFRDRRVPVEQAISVVRQIAAALDYAHQRKIIHRDVKPANIMVELAEGGEPVARVLDFGLAAEVRSSMGRVSREIHDTSGTRPYMAPEQWKGEKQGDQTDQYSLAVLYCELVSGEVPFQSVFECGDPVVMLATVMKREPNIPDLIPLRQRKALRRALSKNPKGRFQTCQDFAEALGGSSGKRIPPIYWMGGALLLALLAGGAFYYFRSKQSVPSTQPIPTESHSIAPDNPLDKLPVPPTPLSSIKMEEPAIVTNSPKLEVKVDLQENDDEEEKRKAEEEEKRKAEEEEAEVKRKAEEDKRKAEADKRKAEEDKRKAEEDKRKAEEAEVKRKAKEAEAKRQAAKAAQKKLAELREKLKNGSVFDPNPPSRAAGTIHTIILPGNVKMSFVWCPPGYFLMGSPESELKRESGEVQHIVHLTHGYWLGQTEVTREQWKSIMGGCSSFAVTSLWGSDGEFPIDEITWRQCQEFCNKLSKAAGAAFRLPTEAEWEYACRAGTSTPFSFGSALNGDRAQCAGATEPYGTSASGSNSYKGTERVRHYAHNAWNLYDMHGNVFEWCADLYGDYGKEEISVDPRGPESGSSRVMRGGCWNYTPKMCRSAFRSRKAETVCDNATGFRVCCDKLPE